jgi:hypothetical protein
MKGCLVLLAVIGTTAGAFAQQSPYLGTPSPLPGRIQAENYDLGGEGVAWHDTSAGNVFGVYRSHDMDVGAIPAGGHHIGFLADGEWAEYTVNVSSAGSYTLRLRYASAYSGTTRFRVLLDGVDLTGAQAITSTGDWQTYTTKSIPVSVTAGNGKVLRVAFDVGAWNLDWLELICTAPVITQHPVTKSPEAGTSVTFTGSASGSPAPSYQWLKNGVAIDGQMSSTLTLANVEQGKDGGTYALRATNSCGSATSSAAKLTVTCKADGRPNPSRVMENIGRAFRGQPDYCDWTTEISTGFPSNFGNGQSYNLPVLAAATAFIKEPVRTTGPVPWNMDSWWTDYLRGELGDRQTAWYYGGQEVGSFSYQNYNIASVLAVHFHAHNTNKLVIRDLARRWLRATFALHALASSPGPPSTFHAQGQQAGGVTYNGPYIAMAGMRSGWGHWYSNDRAILFAQALGRVTTLSGAMEDGGQKRIRDWVEPRWTGPNGNVYGLTATEQTELWNAVAQSTLPADIVGRYLGAGLRTQVPYHLIGWQGVKVTLLERNTHTSTAPTYGVAFFTAPKSASGQEVHFLYPWEGVFVPNDRMHRSGITPGWGRVDFSNYQDRFIEASNESAKGPHPLRIVRIDGLPSTAWRYWLILDPAQPPRIQ